MMSDAFILPYNSKLVANDRKLELLNATFDWFDGCNEVFFDFVKNLYGGVKHEHLMLVDVSDVESAKDKKRKKKEAQQTDLIHVEPNHSEWADNACATFWFRLQEKSTQQDQSIQTPEERIRRFTQYAGHEPSAFALSYLTGNYDPEKHEWVDCRRLYHNFCRVLNVNLDTDIRTMVEHNLLPVIPGNYKINSVFSEVFGVGVKEDKEQKTKWLTTIAESLESKDTWTWEEYRDLIARSTGCSTPSELRSESKGRASKMAIDFASENSGQIPKEWLDQRIEDFKSNAVKKSKTYDMPNRLVLKEYIASKIGPYKLERWSAAAVSGYKDIRSKNSLNLLYSKERLWRCKEIAQILADNPQVAEAQKILENYSAGNPNAFRVVNHHLGDLSVLFKLWEKMNVEAGIEQYSENYRDEYNRDPIEELLRHLYNYRHIPAKLFEAAAKLNSLLLRNERKKINPTVSGQACVSFAPKNTIHGVITPPSHIVRGRRECAGSTGMIWVTMQLLDNGRWVDHHIPFHNSRYYRDFYAYRADLPTLPEPRRKSFGHSIGRNISDTRMINHECKKASKMYLRTIQNMTHNVAFDPQTQFAVRRSGIDTFDITIQARVVGRKFKKEISIGDRVMGIDQNQTTSNTYSVWEVVADGTENSYLYKGKNYRLVEDGLIRSESSGRDQLSYDGLDFRDFAGWRRERYAFLATIGSVLNDEMKPQSEAKAEKARRKKKVAKWRGCSLYSWNLYYADYLKDLMQKNLSKNPDGFRQEILNFIQGSRGVRLCSLNHTSFRLMSKAKSLIHCFFGLNNIKEPEAQERFDKELYDVLSGLNKRKTNKRKEKGNRIASTILQIASRLNVSRIVVENDLPGTSSKNKASANKRATDWCARNVAEKLEYACSMLGISFWQIDPRDTSHLDPFVVGREARFSKVKVEDINEYTISRFKRWHANLDSRSTTAPLYHQALKAFASHYGIDWDNLPEMKFWELKEALKHHDEVLIPNRGGRCYLSTLPITSNAEKLSFNGRERWLNASDIVAGVNIVLRSA